MIRCKKILDLSSLLTLLLSVAGWPLLASADDDNAIVMGVYDAPPNIIRDGGELKGIAPQYIKVIEMLSDLEMTLKPLPYSRLALSSTIQSLDMVNSFSSSTLGKNAEVLTRTGKVKVYLVTLDGLDLHSKSTSDAVSVGITRGLSPIVQKMEQPALKWWDIVSVNDEQHGLRAVMLGRLDGVYATDIAYDYFMGVDPEMQAANFTLSDAGFLDIYLWVRKGEANTPKYQRLKRVVERISFNGSLPVKWWDISDFLEFFSRSK